MALRQIKAGLTGKTIAVFLQDSSSTTGAGLTGLTSATSGLTCYYKRSNDTATVAVTLTATGVVLGTFTDSGFKEIDATNQKGMYEFGIPDAAIAAGAEWVVFFFRGAANLADTPVFIELTATDNQDANGGLSRLDRSISAILTTAMTESYAANGAAMTPAQALHAIHQYLMDFAISGTSYTVKKLDNSTTAFVVTLNDVASPTGAART